MEEKERMKDTLNPGRIQEREKEAIRLQLIDKQLERTRENINRDQKERQLIVAEYMHNTKEVERLQKELGVDKGKGKDRGRDR